MRHGTDHEICGFEQVPCLWMVHGIGTMGLALKIFRLLNSSLKLCWASLVQEIITYTFVDRHRNNHVTSLTCQTHFSVVGDFFELPFSSGADGTTATTKPAISRTCRSILSAISTLLFKNAFTASRPWPRRSSL